MGCQRELTASGGSDFLIALLDFPGMGLIQNPNTCRVQWRKYPGKGSEFFDFMIWGLKWWLCSCMQPKAGVWNGGVLQGFLAHMTPVSSIQNAVALGRCSWKTSVTATIRKEEQNCCCLSIQSKRAVWYLTVKASQDRSDPSVPPCLV